MKQNLLKYNTNEKSKKKEFSFNSLYNRYINSCVKENALKTHDISYDKTLRPNFAQNNKEYIENINYFKQLNNFNLSTTNLKDPLEFFDSPSEVQLEMIKQVELLKYTGGFCLNASCGSGKTIAGLSLIKRLGKRTLIVSARNAVNDQWKTEIEKYFPTLTITTNKLLKTKQSDIIILTPQYLIKHINKEDLSNLKVDLIIFDEVHSLLSDKYGRVLVLGLYMKLNKLIDYLPIVIGLTATIPCVSDKKYRKIERIFGTPLVTEDKIRKIPVKVLDIRTTYPNSFKGYLDENYNSLDDCSAIDVMLEFVYRNKNNNYPKQISSYKLKSQVKKIDTKKFFTLSDFDFSDRINLQNKFLIMTGDISSSIYGALTGCLKFKCNTLIIRANNEKDIFIDYEEFVKNNYHFDRSIDLKDFTKDIKNDLKGVEFCYYKEFLNQSVIICGTYHRLLEGFNCPDITDGICSKFIWSPLSRVQLLGRIRRTRQTDLEFLFSEDKNKLPFVRQFIVNSTSVPSNLFMMRNSRERPCIKYNFEQETKMFCKENYNFSFNMIDKMQIRNILEDLKLKIYRRVPRSFKDEFYLQFSDKSFNEILVYKTTQELNYQYNFKDCKEQQDLIKWVDNLLTDNLLTLSNTDIREHKTKKDSFIIYLNYLIREFDFNVYGLRD